jgi:hypothetical protein
MAILLVLTLHYCPRQRRPSGLHVGLRVPCREDNNMSSSFTAYDDPIVLHIFPSCIHGCSSHTPEHTSADATLQKAPVSSRRRMKTPRTSELEARVRITAWQVAQQAARALQQLADKVQPGSSGTSGSSGSDPERRCERQAKMRGRSE